MFSIRFMLSNCDSIINIKGPLMERISSVRHIDNQTMRGLNRPRSTSSLW